MITIRRAEERGRFDHGWLDTRHTFSFADYHDPKFMGFRNLRVINDDRVAPGQGFGSHSHRDMEIVSYVLEGALAHRDSMGNSGVIRPGDVQRMSAGTGVTHSEFNASATEPVHFLQVWILPERRGLPPRYEQKTFSDAEKSGQLRLVGSRDGRDGSLTVAADAEILAGVLEPGHDVRYSLSPGRHGWVQVARGEVGLDGQRLKEGDGAAVSGEDVIRLTGAGGELLLFDLG